MTAATLTQSQVPFTNPSHNIPFFITDNKGKYQARRALTEDQIIRASEVILQKRVRTETVFSNTTFAGMYLRSKLINYEHEVFACLFLSNSNHLIRYEEMFTGTINSASVYPREVIKKALQLNAAAVIFAHNHPSGSTEPSAADHLITQKLKRALDLVDIQALDHFIIGFGSPYSFADNKKI